MVLTYGFLVLVAVLFSSMVLSNFSRLYLRSEITESNSRLLNQVRIFFDYSLIRPVKGLIASRLLGGSEDLPPLNIDTGGVPPDAFTLYQLSRSLRTFSSLSPLITSALVYYPGADTVITSEHGAFIGVESQGVGVQRMPFYPMYWGLKGNASGSGWLTEGLLCYYQALPLFESGEGKTVYLAVSLDTARIRAEIERITGSPEIVAAAAGPGGVFFSVGEDASVFPGVGTGESGFMVIDSGGRRFGVSWVRSSEEDWTYYLKIPFDIINQRVTGFGRISVILLAAVLMFAFAAVAYATTRLYRPLRSIVDAVTKQAGIGGKSGNELALIEEAFSGLTTRVAERDQALAENRPLIIHKSIIDIIFGYTEGHAGIEEKLSLAGLFGRAFRVAVIALDSGPYGEFTAEMKEFVILRFSEAVRSSVGEPSRLIRYAPWCLVLIAPSRINLGKDRLGPFTRIDLEGFSLRANAAEEDEPVAAEDIHSTFNALQDVERYGGVYGYGLYLKGSEIRRNESSGESVDPKRFAYLKGLLLGGSYDEFLTGLSEDLGRFKQGGYSCDSIETYLYEVSSLMRGLRDSVPEAAVIGRPPPSFSAESKQSGKTAYPQRTGILSPGSVRISRSR